jgi:multiple antibiotic resistance protein
MLEFLKSTTLLLVLLNPFLVSIYLVDLVEKLEGKHFNQVLIRAGLIASVVFCGFAILGDTIFSNLMQAEFASFQIFGGVVFLLIGLQFVFQGPKAIEMLRGESQHLAGAVAMPVLIGPGTISASVVIGKRHDPMSACVIVFVAVMVAITLLILLKWVHDKVRPRFEPLVQRYTEVVGRVMALFVGTVAVNMIMQGVGIWVGKF